MSPESMIFQWVLTFKHLHNYPPKSLCCSKFLGFILITYFARSWRYFQCSILKREGEKFCYVWLKQFGPNGWCHRQNIQRLFIWKLWLFSRILHCIICFMDYSVCIAPTLITALISQLVTKMFCHYNYSHMLLSFLK